MVQQADQIGGCAAGEPIVTECLFGKRVQQAERIVHIRQVAAEMIAVIPVLQHVQHPFFSNLIFYRQCLDRLGKVMLQFFLRDAAKRFILLVHADVARLVEPAEHTYLRELGHARQQHELKVFIRQFKGGIETF